MTSSALSVRACHLQRAYPQDRDRLEGLFQYYLYDMAHLTGARICTEGRYRYDFSRLDGYWKTGDQTPYLIMLGNETVGFSLVQRYPGQPQLWDMEQFFVLRHHRHSGIGRQAFRACVSRHPGRWQIRVMVENTGALTFWENAIRSIPHQGYTAREQDEEGLAMHFLTFETEVTS